MHKLTLYRYYTNPDTFPFPEWAKVPLSLANTLFIPMWVFVASGFATYIPLALHILVCHENIRHILHSAVSLTIIIHVCVCVESVCGGAESGVKNCLCYTVENKVNPL